MLIAAGHHNLLAGNRVVSSGRLPDGRPLRHHFVGIYVWDCCYRHIPEGVWTHNTARDNVVGNAWITTRNTSARTDYRLDHCHPGTCTNNKSLPGTVTTATEKAERTRWVDKLRSRRIQTGMRSS
ncbi:hypothetical protein JD76_01405 [Micromonospora endolithica]|nr:hypothetical protein JD76_01405 [Micromonospora endolithica]